MNIINSAPLPATGWGAAVGSGIYDVLDNLARNKAEEIQYRKNKQRSAEVYEPVFGKKGAAFLAGLDPEIRKVALQNPGLLQQLFPNEGGLPTGTPERYQENQEPSQSLLGNLSRLSNQPNAEQQQYLDQLANPLMSKKPQMPRFGNAGQEPELLSGLNQQQTRTQAAEQQERQPLQDNQRRAQDIANLFTSPEQRIRQQEQARKERKEAREERREEREMTQEEKTRREALVKTRSELVDFVETSKKALDNAKKAKFGTTASVYAENPHLRGRLDEYTSAFDTQATHLANLKAGLIKGVVSVQRLKGILREKPSVGKSRDENIRDLQEYIQAGEQQLKIFDNENPNIVRKFEEASPEAQQRQTQGLSEQERTTPLQDQSGKLAKVVQDDNGNYFLWDDRTQEYRPAKLKGQ